LPQFARQRRISAIQLKVISSSLDTRVTLQTMDRAVCDVLGYLACAPEIVGPAPRDVLIAVDSYRGRLRIVKEDIVVKEVLNSRAALEFLHILLFEYSIGDRPQAPLLHAACLRRKGRRLLLAGAGGAGKSTLAVQLIDAGYEFEGDEHVFVQAQEVVARPRACRIKESSLRLLPESMAKTAAAAPCYHNYDGERIFNVDPRWFGSSWRIEQGTIDCVIALRCNHGGFSSIRPMRSSAAVEFLLAETAWPAGSRAGVVGAVAALAGTAKAYDLSLGAPAGAIRCINSVLAD
jgi:hypothetical protein